jgi:hypothetical protein
MFYEPVVMQQRREHASKIPLSPLLQFNRNQTLRNADNRIRQGLSIQFTNITALK